MSASSVCALYLRASNNRHSNIERQTFAMLERCEQQRYDVTDRQFIEP